MLIYKLNTNIRGILPAIMENLEGKWNPAVQGLGLLSAAAAAAADVAATGVAVAAIEPLQSSQVKTPCAESN